MQPAQLKIPPRWTRTVLLIAAMALPLVFLNSKAEAQNVTGFGAGQGDGQEIGIKLTAINQVKADINAGLYNRPCTPEEHDSTKWHSLVNVEKKCHYDHQHIDDPTYVNDIFGEPGTWFGRSGQSISYPWQTFKATTALEPNDQFVANHQLENDLKHEGYIWIVRRDQACPNGNCVKDFRLQTHAIMGAHDMPVRYHSFSLEVRLCVNANDPNSCGIVRYGGWIDMGRLFTTAPDNIDCGHAVNEVYISLPADSLYFPIDRPEARDEIRCHPNIATLPEYPSNRPLAEWWGHGGGETRFQLRSYDPIGNMDPQDPSKWQFFCAQEDVNCRYDQTIMSAFIGYTLHIHDFADQAKTVRIDANGDGRTDSRGFFDRWGSYNPNCTMAALDCIPFEYNNVVLNYYNNQEARYSQTVCDTCTRFDYDISPPGQKWNTWFYRYADGHTGHETPVPPTPLPDPTEPTLRVDVNPSSAAPGQQVEVTLNLFKVENLYGLQAQCTVNPSVLTGTSHSGGDAFNDSNSLFVDGGFKATDGSWLVAATLKQPNPPVSGNASAFKLSYTAQSAGSSDVTCSVLAVDSNGLDITLQVVNGTYNSVVVTPVVTEEPTPPPPPASPTPTPTLEPTPTPVATQLATIKGIGAYQNHPDNAGIVVQLTDQTGASLAAITTLVDGAYTFTDVPIGTYTVNLSAPQHLTLTHAVQIEADGQVLDLGLSTLPAGDTNDNGIIDLEDASLVGANFSIAVPPAPNGADLNLDTEINIRDLALIGGNFGMTGPIAEQ